MCPRRSPCVGRGARRFFYHSNGFSPLLVVQTSHCFRWPGGLLGDRQGPHWGILAESARRHTTVRDSLSLGVTVSVVLEVQTKW